MFDFGMFKFGHKFGHSHAKMLCCPSRMFLLSACFGVFDFGMCKFGHKFGQSHAKMLSFRHVSSIRLLRHV